MKLSANKLGRLMKGLKRGTQGTETMKFIYKHEVPYNKIVTYEQFVCDYRPQNKRRKEPESPWGAMG